MSPSHAPVPSGQRALAAAALATLSALASCASAPPGLGAPTGAVRYHDGGELRFEALGRIELGPGGPTYRQRAVATRLEAEREYHVGDTDERRWVTSLVRSDEPRWEDVRPSRIRIEARGRRLVDHCPGGRLDAAPLEALDGIRLALRAADADEPYDAWYISLDEDQLTRALRHDAFRDRYARAVLESASSDDLDALLVEAAPMLGGTSDVELALTELVAKRLARRAATRADRDELELAQDDHERLLELDADREPAVASRLAWGLLGRGRKRLDAGEWAGAIADLASARDLDGSLADLVEPDLALAHAHNGTGPAVADAGIGTNRR